MAFTLYQYRNWEVHIHEKLCQLISSVLLSLDFELSSGHFSVSGHDMCQHMQIPACNH